MPADDGSYSSITSGRFAIENEEVAVVWKIVTSQRGQVLRVAVECADSDVHVVVPFAENIVRSALANALSDRVQRFHQRCIAVHHGAALSGEYWLLGSRFAPVIPDEPEPYRIDHERVVELDFVVDAVDAHEAQTVAAAVGNAQLRYLTFLLDTLLQQFAGGWIWVAPEIDGSAQAQPERRLRQPPHVPRKTLGMPKKGELCRLGAFEGSVSDSFRTAAGRP